MGILESIKSMCAWDIWLNMPVFTAAGVADVRVVAHVHAHGVRRAAERFRALRKRRLVAIPEAHARPRCDEALRDGESDSRRPAGDDGVAAFQVELVHGGPWSRDEPASIIKMVRCGNRWSRSPCRAGATTR